MKVYVCVVDTTGFVVSHIERLRLLVRVVWVGPHLPQVVSALTPGLQESSRSLVLLTFKPSVVVPPHDQNFTSVVFPPCEEFSSDVGCKYDLHTLTKLYATMFEQSAKPAYEVGLVKCVLRDHRVNRYNYLLASGICQ